MKRIAAPSLNFRAALDAVAALLFIFVLAVLPARAQDSSTAARKVVVSVSNDSVTGTTLNHLAKLTGAPSKAIAAAITDTDGVIGIVTSGAGTSGAAVIQTSGQVGSASGGGCDFDGATTAGDYVSISSTAAGKCHDAGSAYPMSGQVIGRVLSTNADAGTYPVLLTPGVKAASGGAGSSGEQLLSSTTVNLNTTSATNLYTVPAGKSLILTRCVVRGFSVDPATGSTTTGTVKDNSSNTYFLFGVFQGNGTSGTAQYYFRSAGNTLPSPRTGAVITFTPNIAFGSTATAVVDLFGYTY